MAGLLMRSESFNAVSCVWLAKSNELKLGCKKYFFQGHIIQSSAGDALILLLSLREGDELMRFLQTEKVLTEGKVEAQIARLCCLHILFPRASRRSCSRTVRYVVGFRSNNGRLPLQIVSRL